MRSVVAISAAALALSALAACADAPQRSAERFCGELKAHANEIQSAPPTIEAIPAYITLYSKMGEVAPLDIESDWETVYGSLKTANTINVADPASVQAATDAALATQQAAEKVVVWAQTNCEITLAPVGQVAGGAPAAAATTTTTFVPG
jgi:hypothetical protein